MNLDISYPSVIVAALAAFIIGFLWHGPVFGRQWMKLMKITPAQMKKGQEKMAKKMPVYLLVAFAQQLLTAFVIAVFVSMVAAFDPVSAFLLAFWMWLGLIATTLLNGVLWEERSIPLYLFNITYHLVSIIAITMIVGLWK